VFVRIDGRVAGALVLDDPIRPETPRAVRSLRRAGFTRIIMVTGDHHSVAELVGAAIGLDGVLADRVPADKVDAVRTEREIAGGPLVMVGDGPDRPAIEAMIGHHDLTSRVVFTGALPPSRIAAWMDRCCAIVAPSTLEGFGLSVAEAAWRGRGAVAARVGGLAANITDEVTGLLVPPADPDALAAALLRIATEPGLAERLGDAARKAIELRGDWTGHVDAFEALLKPFPVP